MSRKLAIEGAPGFDPDPISPPKNTIRPDTYVSTEVSLPDRLDPLRNFVRWLECGDLLDQNIYGSDRDRALIEQERNLRHRMAQDSGVLPPREIRRRDVRDAEQFSWERLPR
jgi:hypothetical protein